MNDPQFYDGTPTTPYRGVSGGFRKGKRKRGNSLLKRKPTESVSVYRFDAFDAEGNILALNADMTTYRRGA